MIKLTGERVLEVVRRARHRFTVTLRGGFEPEAKGHA